MGMLSSTSGRKNFPRSPFEKSYSFFMARFLVLPGLSLARSSCRNNSYFALFRRDFQKGVNENQDTSAPILPSAHPSFLMFAVLFIKDRDSQRIQENLCSAIEADPMFSQVLFGFDRVPLKSVAQDSPTAANSLATIHLPVQGGILSLAPMRLTVGYSQPTWPLDSPQQQHRVQAAERERIGNRHADGLLARRVGNIFQVALGIGCGIVGGGQNHPTLDRERRSHQLNRSRRSHSVPVHGFGRADSERASVPAKDLLDRLRLRHVVQSRPGAMGIDVIDLLGVDRRLFERHPHGARGAIH